ncbi:hypothetical protein ACJMK2_034267 [Sinanodonta woodiana]|uniref:Dendritic cell-specific transmembrane protein-like domain-containing protein n=1 Tax=Sinanodonta woodiana TaxID=1069815 RepID=A0ABD3WUT7_SINWO
MDRPLSEPMISKEPNVSDLASQSNSGSRSNTKMMGEKCKACIWRFVGPVYSFLRSSPEEYKILKMCLGFPFGALVAYVLYSILIQPIQLGKETRELIGGVMGLVLASGYAMSVQVRCIVFLIVPTFFSKTGRSYIGTFAIAYLLSGPIQNIIENGQEVTRSLTCAAELAANQTRTRIEFRLAPVAIVLQEMQAEGFFINAAGQKIQRAFKPMRKEIEGVEETEELEEKTKKGENGEERSKIIDERTSVHEGDNKDKFVEKKYKKKVEFRCEDIYTAGVERCRHNFHNLENRCLDKLPLIGELLCLPLKLTIICNLVKLIPGAVGVNCDSADLVNPAFGEAYDASSRATDQMDQQFDVNIQYKIEQTPEDLDYSSAEERRKKTMHEFNQSRTWVDFVMTCLNRLLAFSFVLVIYRAYNYNKKYLSDFRFDNCYVTSYFRKIDSRRLMQRKKTLLPLKRTEANECISPYSLKLMKVERRKLGRGTFILLARAFLAGMIFSTDYLLYSALDIIRRYSKVDYKQTGINHIDIQVGGNGFMSDVVKLFLEAFNTKHDLQQVTTNYECLPRPKKLDDVYYMYVFGIYGIMWILAFLEAYGLRLRRLIASFFYRKREKRRLLYHYNNMLKRRKGYLRFMRRKIKRKAKKEELRQKTGALYALRQQFPRLCRCLSIFTSTKNKCLICNDPEGPGFHLCERIGCKFGYCKECLEDVQGKCYACIPQEEFSSTDSSINSDSTPSESD